MGRAGRRAGVRRGTPCRRRRDQCRLANLLAALDGAIAAIETEMDEGAAVRTWSWSLRVRRTRASTGPTAPTKAIRPSRRALAAATARVREKADARIAAIHELSADELLNPIPKQPPITTMTGAVRALGGLSAVCRWLHTDQHNVALWITQGCVAGVHRLPVYLALVDLGYSKISPTLFALESWEESRLPHMKRPA